MKLSEYAAFDGLALAGLVKAGQVSARELADTAQRAVDRLNGTLNAVIAPVPEETARTLREGPGRGAFEGVPFLIKDIGSHYANVPSECGSRLFAGVTFPHDSELAARFKRAGLVAIGRSNIPEFGASVSTESIATGATRNPWNLSRTPAGSSGGAAVACAAGLGPIGIGTCAGGSTRIPAACNGVVGFKQSLGLIPHDMAPDTIALSG